MWLQAGRCLLPLLPALILGIGQQPVVSFEEPAGSLLLADGSSSPTIIVGQNDSLSVFRAAGDLAIDFGRVTGVNGSVTNASASDASFSGSILVGTIDSPLMQHLIESGSIDVSPIYGKWEAFITTVATSPLPGLGQTLVIIGSSSSVVTAEAHLPQEATAVAQSTVSTTSRNRLAFLHTTSGLMCLHRSTNESSP